MHMHGESYKTQQIRRKRKPGAGRPSLGKVKMTVHILPATRQALGNKPGEVLDAHFGGSNASDQ
ncbi:MAG: hypothetical protein EB060_12125 [Proteobacteria bacterium]|nr:hypothetical protein [Pseudomonadota bacterium]